MFFDILQKALPPPPTDDAEDPLIEDGTLAEGGQPVSNHIIGNGVESGGGGGGKK